ncbi:MAG: PD-(D/E)XK nuclease family protein, partial [Acholeplasmatales bacterium]|nr:PD-(D/E)XK nuclease family protein [Acholeplasmatales bacterium]
YKEYLLNKKYSPSSFYKALTEDDKKSFILNVLLDSDVDKEDDAYNIIDINYKGTLIHSLFEGFQKDEITLNEMLDKANILFDNFLKMKPALIESKIEDQRNDFLTSVRNLYEMSTNNKHILSEVTIDKTNVYGLYFGGQFDRLEKDESERYIVVDYKTGKRTKHEDNDPISCVQGLIYAYLIENGKTKDGNFITDNGKRIKISECQFLYPEVGRPISIKYNDETKQQLKELIEGVVNDIKSGKILHQQEGRIYDNEILYSLVSKVEEEWMTN